MKGNEILKITPWEIEQQAEGYTRRMKNMKWMLAGLVTVPVVNGSFNRPKRSISIKDIFPEDFHGEDTEINQHLLDVIKRTEEERRRYRGGS